MTQNNRAYSLLRGMFLLKISYLNPQVHHMLEVYSLSYGTIAPDKVRVTKLILSVCYLGHVSSCIFCLIGLGAAAKGVDNWIEFNDYKGLSPLSLYLRGYYWAFYTIVTVGFGSISMVSGVERVFAMSLMIIGAIICDAGITAMFSSIIANTDKLSGITRRSKEAIMQFCQSHKYSNDIQKKLTIYYDYLSNDLQNSVEEKDFDLLPPPLQYEFTQIHAFDSLCSLCLLDTDNADTQLGFVYSLMRHMVVTISIPGQVCSHSNHSTSSNNNGAGNLGRVRSRCSHFEARKGLCSACGEIHHEKARLLSRGRSSVSVTSEHCIFGFPWKVSGC